MSIYQEQFINGNATVGTSSSIVSAQDNNIRYIALCNDSTNIIYLAIGGDAVVGKGIRLNASGGTYEVNLQNPIKASISAIATGAGSNLSYTIIK